MKTLQNLKIKTNKTAKVKNTNNQFLTTSKAYFDFLKHAFFFVLFFLFNSLIPISIVLISSSINPFGAQFAAGISFVAFIQIAFAQLSLTVVISILFMIQKYNLNSSMINKRSEKLTLDPQFLGTSLIVIFIYSLLMVPVFQGSSYAYNFFASGHLNTLLARSAANNYIWSVTGYLFLNTFSIFFIMIIYFEKSILAAAISLTVMSMLVVGFSALLSLPVKIADHNFANQYGTLIGIGTTLGAIISVVGLGIYVFKQTILSNVNLKNVGSNSWRLFKDTIKHSGALIAIQVFKGIALMSLFIWNSTLLIQPLPLNMQLTRTVWYCTMYSMPFITFGLSDAILFYGLQKHNEKLSVLTFLKVSISSLAVAFLLQMGIAGGIYHTMQPFGEWLMRNNSIKQGEIPSKWFQVESVDYNYVMSVLDNKIKVYTDLGEQFNAGMVATLKAALQGVYTNNPADFNVIVMKAMTYNDFVWQSPNGQMMPLSALLNSPKKVGGNLLYNFGGNPNASSSFNVFFYLATWTLTYSTGLALFSTTLVLRKEYHNVKDMLSTILIQVLIIITIFPLGVHYQSTSTLKVMDGWTVAFVAYGSVIFLLYIAKVAKMWTSIKEDQLLIDYVATKNEKINATTFINKIKK